MRGVRRPLDAGCVAALPLSNSIMITVACILLKKTAVDVLLHPIRLRIVRAFLGDAELTARDVAEKLDDVPQATLYRHLKHLADAGALIVISETPVRGAMERTYRLDPNTARYRTKTSQPSLQRPT